MPIYLMYEHLFEIATDGTGTTYAPIAAGISHAEPDNNEDLAQDKYLDGDGFGETDVIGAQMILSFSGHRMIGDAAQDYIFGKVLALGASRRTLFRWTEPDGGVFDGACTIANIKGPGGDAGAKGEISFEIHFAGAPAYTPPA